MLLRFILSLIVAFILLVPAVADDEETPTTLHVSAEASVNATPDMAQFTLGVKTTHPQPDKAMQENASKMRRVLRALRSELPEEQVRTLSLNLRKVEDWDRDSRRSVFRHYEATNQVKVSVYGKLDELSGLIGGAVDAGANLAGSISLQLKDQEPHQLAALRLATRKLQRKARAIAEASGHRLGRLMHIRESAGVVYPRHQVNYASGLERAAVAQSAAPPIAVGDLTTRAQLTAEYELLP